MKTVLELHLSASSTQLFNFSFNLPLEKRSVQLISYLRSLHRSPVGKLNMARTNSDSPTATTTPPSDFSVPIKWCHGQPGVQSKFQWQAFFFSLKRKSLLDCVRCRMWNLVSWPVIEPGLLPLGVWSLSHWTTREVPSPFHLFRTLSFSQEDKTKHYLPKTFDVLILS